jgi:hypothetical protein
MKTKNDPDLAGLKNALNEREIIIVEKNDGVISIDTRGGIFIGEVLPPSENEIKKRVVRFSRAEDDYLDPSLYGYIAILGIGSEILFRPIGKPGDL